LRGLEYVHARGVVHGDVKPENVLVSHVSGEAQACLIDFGLSARTGEGGDGIAGTAAYLAPEVIREEPASPSADLYSFGVMAYEVLTGRRPFQGDDRDPGALLRAHLELVPDAPTAVAPELPPTIDAVLLSLLEKAPGDRPGTAREALSALGAALDLRFEAETVATLKGYLRSGRLVGRDAQLARARSLLDRLRVGGTTDALHLLWWWGPRGAGRTRLLTQLGGDALIDGARVVHARGGEGGPMGPVLAWLRGLGVLADPLQGASDRWDAIQRAVAQLAGAAAGSPVLLALDDADAADEMTMDALRVLLEGLAAAHAPGSETEAPPLAILVTSSAPPTGLSAAYAALYEVQALAPLSRPGVTEWLSWLVPGRELPEQLIAGIHRLTEGLPGHMVTLLGAMAERGHLTINDGALVMHSKALSAPLPDSLQDALAQREAALPELARHTLSVLRALGAAAPIGVVAAIVGASSDTSDVLGALRRLQVRGLAGPVPGTDLWRAEGVSPGLDAAAARALHAGIARTLMGMGGRSVIPGFGMAAVAHHAAEAVRLGEDRLAAAGYRAALVAAEDARAVHAAEEESRLLAIAHTLGADGVVSTDRRLDVALRLGALYTRLGRFDDAAAILGPVGGDDAILGLAAIDFSRGDYPSALERARSVGASASRAGDALARSARSLLMMGRYDEALADCETGLAEDSGGRADLLGVKALVFYYTSSDQALDAFEAAAVACREAADPVGEAAAVNGGGLIHHRRGDFEQALKAYEHSLAIAEQSGDRKRVAVAAMNIGTILHETGRAVEAAARYRESLDAAQLLGDGAAVARAALNLGNLLIYLNRLPEARFWLERSRTESEEQQQRLLVAYADGLLGKALHHDGELEAARARLLGAVETLREIGNIGEAGELILELGMIARTAGDSEGMEHFAARAEQSAQSSGAEKQQAFVKFLRGEARRTAGEFGEAVPLLRQALVLADRHRLLDLGWRCEAGLGRCYREQGNAMEARARFNACSERIFGQAAALSGRERDVFLAETERAAVVEESRLALGDGGSLPTAQRENQEQLIRLMEINRRLVSEPDIQRLLEFILDSAIQLTGAERGFVILGEEEEANKELSERTFDVRCARNIDQESVRKGRARVSRSITMDAIETGEPIITVDAGEDVRFRDASSVHHLKLRSILCFPLKATGRSIGAIYLDNRFQRSTFSERDLDVIGAFGDQAAMAITRARMHERMVKTQHELETSNQQIEALNKELQARVSHQAARLEEIETSLARQRNQLETRYQYDNIIGAGTAMQRVFGVLDRVTDTGVPVLVQGESGTGKELVARAIHYNGAKRRDRSFVSVNCAALTETLLESELFGHVRGAFTGADRDRKGLFEVADGGTLFLDEVADMSLAMQAKLLRALQEGEVWPVGGRRALKVDVRIVAACNRDLQEMVKTGEFRQDLYFRLNVVRLILPPLRERGEDLVLLVQHFLRGFAEKHSRPLLKVSTGAMDRLLKYGWPGNVRELEACLTNACLFCDTDSIQEGHLTHKPELFEDHPRHDPGSADAPSRLAGELLDLGNMSLSELEEKAILASLERAGGNKVEAAKRLGITRQTLYNKLKSLGIEVRRRVKRT
ncbi:MAG: serine/threonine-protein kinase PknK, partial [Myxococcota bacterium]